MELKVSNIPASMPEERMKDRLEMSFSRPSRGGGEVESVEYDNNSGTGQITFLHPGGTTLWTTFTKNMVQYCVLPFSVNSQPHSV